MGNEIKVCVVSLVTIFKTLTNLSFLLNYFAEIDRGQDLRPGQATLNPTNAEANRGLVLSITFFASQWQNLDYHNKLRSEVPTPRELLKPQTNQILHNRTAQKKTMSYEVNPSAKKPSITC